LRLLAWRVKLSETLHRVGIVVIVDDDEDLREALASLLTASRFTIDSFSTAEAFLEFPHRKETRCLILDVRLPGMSGIELQKRLIDEGDRFPIVFISAHGDDSVRDLVMKAGAVAFLTKPVRSHTLLGEIDAALNRPGGDGKSLSA
jgi:FixJ family two-component response regulator